MYGEVIERRLDGSRLRVRAHMYWTGVVSYSAAICGKGKRKWVNIIDQDNYTYRRSEFPRDNLEYNCVLFVAGSDLLQKAHQELVKKVIASMPPCITDLREMDEAGEDYFEQIKEKVL